MAAKTGHENALLTLSGGFTAELQIARAIVQEKLSTLTDMQVEFVTRDNKFKIDDTLGRKMTINVELTDGTKRRFSGIVVAIEELEHMTGLRHFLAEVRPEFWITTRARNNRIFQEKDAAEIIHDVLNEHGLSDHKVSASGSFSVREYCVQYGETDFDFINRLMEEEGIYYYFEYEGTGDKEMLVMASGTGGIKPIDGVSTLEFWPRDGGQTRREDHIQEWQRSQKITSGKVDMRDYDYTVPNTDLLVSKKDEKGAHFYNEKVLYDYPGHYRKDEALGGTRARIRMEAEAVRYERRTGMATVRTLMTGRKFSLTGLEGVRKSDNKADFLQTDAVYFLQETTGMDQEKVAEQSPLVFPEEAQGMFTIAFGAIPARTPYRAPLDTPWPRIAGLQTAIVTGPSGEEIHTDKDGRIKVQFHWDRQGKKDDKTSCWVRVATPWSGQGWGAVAIPRIGQEVIVQFEEGNPDRPICTGMLYNSSTMPPYGLPDNATQSGVKTNSSKGGGGFNELMFEDKKGAELVRFQSQRDYQQIVKNNATITVGLETAKDGDMSLEVKNNRAETIGNDETISVGHNRTEAVGADETIDIGANQTQTIGTNRTLDVGSNEDHSIGSDHSQSVGQNQAVDVGMKQTVSIGTEGKISAGMSYEIKVGGSSIKIDPSGVTIKGPIIKIEGGAMIDAKSPLTQVKGDALLILKGGITLIN